MLQSWGGISSSGLGRSPGGGHGSPLQYSCLESPMDRAAWRATAHGVADTRTRLNDWAHGWLTTLIPLWRHIFFQTPFHYSVWHDIEYDYLIPWGIPQISVAYLFYVEHLISVNQFTCHTFNPKHLNYPAPPLHEPYLPFPIGNHPFGIYNNKIQGICVQKQTNRRK